jgi:dTDP-4-amino-4,6-dideoxygalactose transaminase
VLHWIYIEKMFDKILKFEQELAEYTGAPYAIMTDCCTHAIEMCLRYDQVKETCFTPYTYLSVPMTMHKLGINYTYSDEEHQHWIGEYQFFGTRIWDSARRLERNMYRSGTLTCISFGRTKPLAIGRCGAILLDDLGAYRVMILQRYDGRDLSIVPWETQKVFHVGYHYKPSIEEAELGSKLLPLVNEAPKYVKYPDCRKIKIID